MATLPLPTLTNILKLAVINARSSNKKLIDITNQFDFGNISLACISETWEKEGGEKKIEEVEECHGLSWISQRRRMGTGRGGGVAIVAKNSMGTLRKLEVDVPVEVEAVWGIFCPAVKEGEKIIIGAFYSSNTSEYKPPKNALQYHILDILEQTSQTYPEAHYVIAGDINKDTVDEIIELDNFKNHVDQPTREDAFLDIAVSDMQSIGCFIAPPLAPDNDDDGTSSDHKIAIVDLVVPGAEQRKREKIIINKRIISNSSLEKFVEDYQEIWWWDLATLGVDESWELFQTKTAALIDKHFPLHRRTVKVGDPLFFGEALQKQKLHLDKLFRRLGGQDRKFKAAKRSFRNNFLEAKRNFYNARLDENRRRNSRQFHKDIQGLMSSGARRQSQTPEVKEMVGMDQEARAELLVDTIANLTAGYEPLNLPQTQAKFPGGEPIILTLEEIIQGLKTMNLPRGLHLNDPPREILRVCRQLFAVPMLLIINKVLAKSTWPTAWKDEQTSMIPKRSTIMELGDLRPVVHCPVMSKLAEHVLKDRILTPVRQNLEPCQFGSIKGMSTDHYLATLWQEIIEADNEKLTSVLITWDFKGAFNALRHQTVVQAASDLGVDNVLVRLIASYLHGRSTTVKWGNILSSPRTAAGGSGQGTVWSSSLFVMALNYCLKAMNEALSDLESQQDFRRSKPFAWVDDVAVLLHFRKSSFRKDQEGVYQFEDDGRIAACLEVMKNFTQNTGMKLNPTKTKAITFDYSQPRVNFPPDCLSLGMEVKLVDKLKLLGVIVDEDLTLDPFVADRRRKGLYASWGLRRLQGQGVEKVHLRAAYLGYVRSITEYGLLTTSPILNIEQWAKIEAVQRRATKTCLGIRPLAYGMGVPLYQDRLESLKIPHLQTRTETRLRNFAIKNEFEERFSPYFKRREIVRNTRNPRPYVIPRPRIEKLKKSPFYVMSGYLNDLDTTPEQRQAPSGH